MDTNGNNLQVKRKRIRSESEVRNSSLVGDPTIIAPGFDLPCALWATLNRIRTNQGKYNYLLHKWV